MPDETELDLLAVMRAREHIDDVLMNDGGDHVSVDRDHLVFLMRTLAWLMRRVYRRSA